MSEVDPQAVTRWARANQKRRLLRDFFTFAKGTGICWSIVEDPYREVCDFLESCLPNTPGILAWRIDTGRYDVKPARLDQSFFMFLMPRLTFKTSLLSALCIFAILVELEYTGKVDLRIALGRSTTADSEATLDGIKTQIENNQVIRAAWGNLRSRFERWTNEAITFRDRNPGFREPTIATTGLNTSATGSHIDLAILDDLVNETNYQSPIVMETARNKVQAFFPVIERWATMLVVGTRWSEIDVYGWLMDEDEKRVRDGGEAEWHTIIWGAYRENQTARFPTVLPEWLLDKMRGRTTAKMFAAWYLNVARAEGEDIFTLAYIRYFDGDFTGGPFPQLMLPEYNDDGTLSQFNADLRKRFGEYVRLHVVMLVDPAPTTPRNLRNRRADFTGVVVVGFDESGNYWVLYAAEVKKLPTERLELLCHLARRFTPSTLALENADMDGVLLQNKLSEMGLDTKVVLFSPTYDRRQITKSELAPKGMRHKEAQIEATEPVLKARRVFFQAGETVPLVAQLTRYPQIEHDDVIDAFSMALAYEQKAVAEISADPMDLFERIERREYALEGLDFETGEPVDQPKSPRKVGQTAGLLSA